MATASKTITLDGVQIDQIQLMTDQSGGVHVYDDYYVTSSDQIVEGKTQEVTGVLDSALQASTASLQKGDTMTIEGQREPCPSCRGYMNRAAASSGAEIIYRWDGHEWITGR